MCGGHTRRPVGPSAPSLRTIFDPLSRLLQLAAALVFVLAPVRAATAQDNTDDDGPPPEATPDDDGEGSATRPAPPSGPTEPAAVVLVTAPLPPPRSPGSGTSIDLRDRARPAEDLADVLDAVAGFQVRRTGGPGDPAFVGVRGSTARQVEVFIDGVPLNPGGSGPVDLASLPLSGFDSVELSRGFAPFGLGAAPLGGAIEFRSAPASVPAPWAQIGLGSFGSRRLTLRGGWVPPGTQADLSLFADYESSKGDYRYLDTGATPYTQLDDRTRRRANNRVDRLHLWMRLRAEGRAHAVRLSQRLGFTHGGEPGSGHGLTQASATTNLDGLSTIEVELRPVAMAVARITGSARVRRLLLDDPLGEIGVASQRRADWLIDPTLALVLQLRPAPPLELSASAHGAMDLWSSYDALSSDPDKGWLWRARLGVGGQIVVGRTTDPATVEGAVLVSFLDQRAIGRDPWDGSPVPMAANAAVASILPRIAGRVRPHERVEVRGSFALGHRPPDLLELFGDQGRFAGNSDLLPESGHGADLSVRLALDPHDRVRLRLEGGPFFAESRDTIVYVPNSQHVTVPLNFGRTRTAGIEAALQLAIGTAFAVDVAYTRTHATIVESAQGAVGNLVPSVPPWEIDLGVEGGPWPFLRLGGRLSVHGPTPESASNAFIRPTRPRHDVFLRLSPWRDGPSLAVDLRNLFDTRLATRVRDGANPSEDDREVVPLTDFRAWPLAGRSVMVTLDLPLQPPAAASRPRP